MLSSARGYRRQRPTGLYLDIRFHGAELPAPPPHARVLQDNGGRGRVGVGERTRVGGEGGWGREWSGVTTRSERPSRRGGEDESI